MQNTQVRNNPILFNINIHTHTHTHTHYPAGKQVRTALLLYILSIISQKCTNETGKNTESMYTACGKITN